MAYTLCKRKQTAVCTLVGGSGQWLSVEPESELEKFVGKWVKV